MTAVEPSSAWDHFSADPRRPDLASIRASDTDRGVVVDVLTTGYVGGRLTREEYDDRSSRAAAIQTLGEVPALIGDLVLPEASPVDVVGRSRAHRAHADRPGLAARSRQHAAAIAGVGASLGSWTTWFLASYQHNEDPGFPWPVVVTLGTAAYWSRVRTQRRSTRRIDPAGR